MHQKRAATSRQSDVAAVEERAAKRVTLLIRVAKLISPQGEFVCVIRDISETGIRLRGFHSLPSTSPLELELQTGDRHRVEPVWSRGWESGFRFVDEVDVTAVVVEAGRFPKRKLRLTIGFPVQVLWSGNEVPAYVINISQQGAQIACTGRFALAQSVVLRSDKLPDVRARVRWRKDEHYGLVFDDTFSFSELATFAAGLQCPSLLTA